MSYLRYHPAIEKIGEDEKETFRRIAETFTEMGRHVEKQNGRAMRVSHAKATALLIGELAIDETLPSELAQGIADRPTSYEALVRFAQGPGEPLDDKISTHRGMAVKLLGVPGEQIAESINPACQDFVLEAGSKAFIYSNAETFLTNLRAGVSNAPSLPQPVKSAVSLVSRATEAGLETIGLSSKTLSFFGHPPFHPLAEAYFSQAPMRWGDYVGKIGFFPTDEMLATIRAIKINDRGENGFRSAMLNHFAQHGASFELRVQLATDLESTSIEDAAQEWPEADNPYRRVGKLNMASQTAWSSDRDAYFDRLSFRPANSLVTYRPLGQVMRARLAVYGALVAFRQERNGQSVASPNSAADVPL